MEKQWFNKTVKDVEKELQTDLNKGLDNSKVVAHREKYGLNELKEGKKETLIQKFIAQFKDFSIIVLIIAAIVSGIVGVAEGEGITDTIIIMIVVLVNAIIGVAQEAKAEKSLEALKKLSTPHAKVLRDGVVQSVNSTELVPGDIVVLEAGDFVPADGRLIEAVSLIIDESALTGESVPVTKSIEVIDKEDVSLGDMHNCMFSSTYVTYGRGKAIVTGTGMNTEIGKIASMLSEQKEELTPLQHKLNKVGSSIGILCLIPFFAEKENKTKHNNKNGLKLQSGFCYATNIYSQKNTLFFIGFAIDIFSGGG